MLRNAGWHKTRATVPPMKRDVSGKRLGIVGLGQIGQALARMAHHGLNMQVAGYRPSMKPALDYVEMQPLETLFAESDFIVLACPLNETTRGLVNARLIARMQPLAVLVNVARGAVIEEPALIKALQEKRIGGAALDVFTTQPLPADSPLMHLENVILSTHMAGMTRESMLRMGDGVVDQVLQLLRGELPTHLVNTEHREAIAERLRMLTGKH